MTTTYADLLRKKLPRVIRTEAENAGALREIERLMDLGDAITPAEADYLKLLTVLVEHFENEHYAFEPAPPLAILRELMEQHGLKQTELADVFGSKAVASEVFAGKRDISVNAARKLGERFKVSASLFLGLD